MNYILSIESSCDDSSIAITDIKTKKLIFHKKISQELEHSLYGGVVPELATRLHATALPNILQECKSYFNDLKAVAVTNEPGLFVTLMEGVIMAKAIAISLKVPLIAVNHLKGHIYSLFINKQTHLPLIVLLISGGHTQLIEVKNFNEMRVVATSSDDSFGESFDKVARMMELAYPGGPIIENLARAGNENSFDFPVPLSKSKKMEFSYSGLKNAVRLKIQKLTQDSMLTQRQKCDIAASFQKAATKHLLQKTKKYLTSKRVTIDTFAIVGGASANIYVREAFKTLCKEFTLDIIFANLPYCSDNAAMIGRAAIYSYKHKLFTSMNALEINSKARL